MAQQGARAPRRRYFAVAEEILYSIATGGLGPGSRLPDERALAEQCSVSRSTAREALLALELSGIIEVRPGAGSYVATPSRPVSALPSEASPKNIIETRSVVETAAARLGAENFSPAGGRELERALSISSDHLDADDASGYWISNVAFHREVARSSGNPVLTHIIEQLIDPDQHPLWTMVDSITSQAHENRAGQHGEHQLIYAAIVSGDADGAEAAMKSHLAAISARIFGGGGGGLRPARPRNIQR